MNNLKDSISAFYYSNALCDLQLMNRNFSNTSVTYNSLLYLEIIFSMKGKCTASILSKLLCVSKPAVTLKLNELIKNGFVIKNCDSEDHRKYYLSVNEEAVPQYKIYRKQDNEAVKQISEKYSEEDINKFCDMLNIITKINFDEANREVNKNGD